MPDLKTDFYIKRKRDFWDHFFQCSGPSISAQTGKFLQGQQSPLLPQGGAMDGFLHIPCTENGFKESCFVDYTSNVWIPWGQNLKVEDPSVTALWGSRPKQDVWVRASLLPGSGVYFLSMHSCHWALHCYHNNRSKGSGFLPGFVCLFLYP